jgi:hypothetical protein
VRNSRRTKNTQKSKPSTTTTKMSRLRSSSSWLSNYYLGKYGTAYPNTFPYYHGFPYSWGGGALRILPYMTPVPTLFVAAPSGPYNAASAELDWTDVRLSCGADEGYLCETASEAAQVIGEFLNVKWAHLPNIQIIFSGWASDPDNVWEFKDGSVLPFSQLGHAVLDRRAPLVLEIHSAAPNTAKWNTKVAEFNAKTTKHKIVLMAGDLKGQRYGYHGLGYGYPYHGMGYGYGYGLENFGGLGYSAALSVGYPFYDYSVLPTKLATTAKELREKLAAIPASPDVSSAVAEPVAVPEPACSAVAEAEKSATDADAAAVYVAGLAQQAAEHLESAKALAAKAQAEKQAQADAQAKIEAARKADELRVARETAVAEARAAAEEAWKAEQAARAAAVAKAEQDRLDAIKRAEEMRAAEMAAAAAAAAAAEEARLKAVAEAKAAEEARIAAAKAEEERITSEIRAAEEARVAALKAADEARIAAMKESEANRVAALKKMGPFLHNYRYPYRYGYRYGHHGYPYGHHGYSYGQYGYPYGYYAGSALPGLVAA